MSRQRQHPRSGPSAALAALVAVLAIAGGAAAGVLLVDRLPAPVPDASSASPAATDEPVAADVRGSDLADLPRFPGSVRTDYVRQRQGSAQVTAIVYASADAELDDVRAFYRRIFRERAWELIELDFSSGEWIFLVERKGRVALVEIEDHGRRVIVEIELERPIAARTPPSTPTPRPQAPAPAPPPPPPAPPPGDDDDDDADDDD
jgi:hypothetical protein